MKYLSVCVFDFETSYLRNHSILDSILHLQRSKVGFWTIDSIVVLNFLLEMKTKLNPDLSQTSHENENLHEDDDDVSVISSNCSYIVDTTKHSYHDYDDGQWETE